VTAMLTRTMTVNEARVHVLDLIHEHHLLGWRFKLDSAKKRAGRCSYRDQTISLSRYLLAQRSYEDSLNTITHEIAHALVGGLHGHDAVWAAKHRELGGDGKQYFQREGVDMEAPWIGRCAHKEAVAVRYRKPKRLDGWNCNCPEGRSQVEWIHNR
jgi:hypothetical protein